MLAEDIIGCSEWTCLGIDKLAIEIQVSSPSADQLEMRISDRIRNKFIPEEEDEKIPEDETLTPAQQQASHSIQRQVYAKLSQLRNLSEINFGPRHAVDPKLLLNETEIVLSLKSQREVVKRGLDFLQESEFGLLLEPLPYLRKIELSKSIHSEESAYDELSWIKERGWGIIHEKCEKKVISAMVHRLL